MHGHAHRHGHGAVCQHDHATQALAADLKRVEEEARLRFRLRDGVPVRVVELAATERGFPPRETRITFWSGNEAEHQYRVFKPAGEVTASDLPPWWMKDALILDPWPSCDCCG